jgi:hypothetical protein
MFSTPVAPAQHAVHVEDQPGLFTSGKEEVPASARNPSGVEAVG